MLISKEIGLRAITVEDADIIRDWRNNPEAALWFFSYQNISHSMQVDWINTHNKKEDEVNWIIYLTEKNTPIGTLSLIDIDNRNKNAEYARLIVDPLYKGKGYAYIAEMLLLEYAFNYLNLNKVHCKTYVDNTMVINLHKKTGFKEVGIMKNHIYRDGKYIDINIFELLKEEWDNEALVNYTS